MSEGSEVNDSKEEVSTSLADSGISICEIFSENKPDVKAVISPGQKKVRKNAARSKHCHICVRTFKNATDLRRHLLIHTNEKPHECEICKKSYRQEVNLNNHIIMVHTNKRNFKCQFCRKPFGLKSQLKHHLQVHSGEKPYLCPICDMTFAQGGQLEKHLEIHGKREKKCCKLCFTKFTSERNLRIHMKRHDQGPGVVCQICNKVFKNDIVLQTHRKMNHGKVKPECQICELTVDGDMQSHMKAHFPKKPVECEFCDARFVSKTQYEVHKRTHTKEKPFQCRVCWQSFGHKNVLKRHVRKHTGEKPYQCVLCSSTTTFSQLCHLKTHMRTIHYKDKTYVCEGCKESFKVMFQLERHKEFCDKTDPPTEFDDFEREKRRQDAMLLTRLRYLVAVLLKTISTKEKLSELGFDKRLIDHVLIASLKVAKRKCYQSKKMDELDRMKLNIQAFLEWIVPANVLDVFKKDCESIEIILDMIVTMNLKEPIII